MTITRASRLERKCEVLCAQVNGDEAVMLSIEAGRFFGLNAVALRIWELIETPRTVADVCEQICEEFEVEPETCEAGVIAFAEESAAQGILDVA